MKTEAAVKQLTVVDEKQKTVRALKLSIVEVNTYIELGYKVIIVQPVIIEDES